MAGLLIIIVYLFFWWFCWLIAKSSFEDRDQAVGMKRLAVFLALGAMPYYYYLFEEARYKKACESVAVYFPKEKISVPNALITNSTYYKNTIGELEGKFDYLISPQRNSSVSFDKGISQFRDFLVYPYEGRELINTEEYKREVINTSRYGYFQEHKKISNNISEYTRFIFDFEEKKKLSSYSTISYQVELHSIQHYLFGFSFKECEYRNSNYGDFKFNTNSLFEMTFKNWKSK